MLTKIIDHLKKEDPFSVPHRGIVVATDKDEKDHLGRVKCFIKGIYEEKDIDKLPWIYPQATAGLGGRHDVSSCVVPEVNSELTIEFKHNDIYSPFYTGRWVNKEATQQKLFDEDYPESYGHQDSTGTWWKVNKEKKYAEFLHTSGMYWRVDKDGNVDWNIPGSLTMNIEKDMHVNVKGDLNVKVKGDYTVKVNGDYNEKVDGAHGMKVGEDQTLKVVGDQETKVSGDQKLIVNGDQNMSVDGDMNHWGAMINHNTGSPPSDDSEDTGSLGAAALGFSLNKPRSLGAAAAGFVEDMLNGAITYVEGELSSALDGLLGGLVGKLTNALNNFSGLISQLFAKSFRPDLVDLMDRVKTVLEERKEIEQLAEKAIDKLKKEVEDSDSEDS